MATNIKRDRSSDVRVELTVGASKSAGAVEIISEMPVLLLEDSDSDNKATCVIPGCGITAELSVVGANNAGNSAVAVGDKIYNDSGTYNKDATNGVLIGFALGTVGSGATATIEVALI